MFFNVDAKQATAEYRTNLPTRRGKWCFNNGYGDESKRDDSDKVKKTRGNKNNIWVTVEFVENNDDSESTLEREAVIEVAATMNVINVIGEK